MNIIIDRLSEDWLTKQVWTFYAHFGHGSVFELRLDQWKQERRKTKRHKWELDGEGYTRRYANTHHSKGWRRPAAEVPMPQDVVDEARSYLFSRLVVAGPVDPAESRRTV